MAVELLAGLHQLGRAEPQGEGEVGAPRALLLGHRLSGFILTISTSQGAPVRGELLLQVQEANKPVPFWAQV